MRVAQHVYICLAKHVQYFISLVRGQASGMRGVN